MGQAHAWCAVVVGASLLCPGCILDDDDGGAASDVIPVECVASDALSAPSAEVDAGALMPQWPDAGADAYADSSDGTCSGDSGPCSEPVGDASSDAEDAPARAAGDAPTRAPLPDHVFRVGNDELGLPKLMSATVSIGDIDGDGWPDLLSGGRQGVPDSHTAIFYNPGGQGFVQADLAAAVTAGPAPLLDVLSTSIVDLNGDGLADLMLGGVERARVQVLFQRAGGTFESTDIYETDAHPGARVTSMEVADMDGNGLLDLYLAIQWPPQRLKPWAETIDNVLMVAIGAEEWVDATSQHEAFHWCGRKQAYSAQFIPRSVFGLPGLLHVANDLTRNCLWTVEPGLPHPTFAAVPDPTMAMHDADYSMGADWIYSGADGDVLMLSVEVGYHVLYAIRDGELLEETSRMEWTDKDYVGWGGLFFDADNDGDDDIVIASGKAYDNDQQLAFASQFRPNQIPAFVSKLLYWEQEADGGFRYDPEYAGPMFDEDTGEYYGMAVADLNRDGCLDVVATPRAVITRTDQVDVGPDDWTYETDTWAFMAPGVHVMLNNCPAPANHWAAFRVPDRPGLVVRVTLSDGSQRLAAVKGNVGTGMRSGGGVVHFGLGATATVVEAELLGLDGKLLSTVTDVASDVVTTLEP